MFPAIKTQKPVKSDFPGTKTGTTEVPPLVI
jgi:hypothetical protein